MESGRRRRTFSEQLQTESPLLGSALSWVLNRTRSRSVELDVIPDSNSGSEADAASKPLAKDPMEAVWKELESSPPPPSLKTMKITLGEVKRRTELYSTLTKKLKENAAKGEALATKIDSQLVPRLTQIPLQVSGTRERLETVEAMLELLRKVRSVAVDLQTLRVLYDDEKEPLRLVETLLRAEENAEILDNREISCASVFLREVSWWRDQITLALHVAWKRHFLVAEEIVDGRGVISLKTGCPFDSSVSDFVSSLEKLGLLEDCVALLARQTAEHVVGRMVTLEPKIVHLTEDPDAFSIRLLKNSTGSAETRFDFVTPLLPVIEALEFLNRKVLSRDVSGRDLMSVFASSSNLAAEFRAKLRGDLLTSSLPDDLSSLGAFSAAVKDFTDLERRLVAINLLSDDLASEFVSGRVETLFAEKRRDEILGEVRRTVETKIRNVVTVGREDEAVDSLLNHSRNCVGEWKQVSENASKLTQLLRKLEEEAKVAEERGFPFVSRTLRRCSRREVFELYLKLVPVFHETEAKKFPYVAAILRNDAWHLADFVVRTTKTFGSPDLDRRLRDFGSHFLTEQLKGQKEALHESLRYGGGFPVCADDQRNATASKCVKRAFVLLKSLHGVWSKCLPYRVFAASTALLVDALAEEILRQILTCEDIAASSAAAFAELLRVAVLDEVPALFKVVRPTAAGDETVEVRPSSPGRVYDFVPRLLTLREMSFVLEARLADIEERWGGGKGPLALAFPPDKLKFLIRALFMDTDKRAKVLACIS